jgi:hypothetical protein
MMQPAGSGSDGAFADFDHRVLVAPLSITPDCFAPTRTYCGLPQVAAFLFGTVFDSSRNAWTYARDLPPHGTTGAMLMSNQDQVAMRIRPESAQSWRGAVQFEHDDTRAIWQSADGARLTEPSLRLKRGARQVELRDRGLLALLGTAHGPAYQWYDPTGRQAAVCMLHFVNGEVQGKPVLGWLGLDLHYQRPGLNHFTSALVAGGLSLAWMTFATMFEDGSWETGLMAKGRRSFGFAIVGDSGGGLTSSTRVNASFDAKSSGYPERMQFQYFDDSVGKPMEWGWLAGDRAEMVDIPASAPTRRHNRGSEGTLLRAGETRRPSHASAWTEFFADGRVEQWRKSGR